MDPGAKPHLASDVVLAWRAIANGTTAQTASTREKYWACWRRYCSTWKEDPYLQDAPDLTRTIILTAFAARVRSGFYGRGNEIKVPSVADALASVAKTIELAGKQSPIHRAPDTYTVPIQRCLEGMRRSDPPSIPQLAVPASVPKEAHRQGYATTSPKLQATADLATIAFYLVVCSWLLEFFQFVSKVSSPSITFLEDGLHFLSVENSTSASISTYRTTGIMVAQMLSPILQTEKNNRRIRLLLTLLITVPKQNDRATDKSVCW